MLKFIKLLAMPLLFVSIALGPLSLRAQSQTNSEKVPVTTVVTVLGPAYTAPPALGKSDVIVHTGQVREDVTQWTPAQGEKAALELAILIDDGADINTQLDDIRKFIQAQPKNSSVGLFYASSGLTQTVAPFSADHDAVAKKLRITQGLTSTSTSIYLSLMDLMSKWRATGARREILVLADGIDRFRGDPFSTDVPLTVERAQKAGIMIHALYAQGVDRAARNLFRSNWGQSNLAQMSDGTGGESFFQGNNTPVSFAPFLEKLDMVLHNQYFLTFTTTRSAKAKGELRHFRVNTEQRNVEISAARFVLVPGHAK
jgi:hypothetical protein